MGARITEKLNDLCRRKKITQKTMLSDLSIPQSTFQSWNYEYPPSSATILKIANYFDVSTDYLLGRTEIMEPAEDIINDENIIFMQRAKQGAPEEYKILIKIAETLFSEYFPNNED